MSTKKKDLESEFSDIQDKAETEIKNSKKNIRLTRKLEKTPNFENKLKLYYKQHKIKGTAPFSAAFHTLKKGKNKYFLYSLKLDPDMHLYDGLEYIKFTKIDSGIMEIYADEGEYVLGVSIKGKVVVAGRRKNNVLIKIVKETEIRLPKKSFNFSTIPQGNEIESKYSFVIGKNKIIKYIGQKNFTKLADFYKNNKKE